MPVAGASCTRVSLCTGAGEADPVAPRLCSALAGNCILVSDTTLPQSDCGIEMFCELRERLAPISALVRRSTGICKQDIVCESSDPCSRLASRCTGLGDCVLGDSAPEAVTATLCAGTGDCVLGDCTPEAEANVALGMRVIRLFCIMEAGDRDRGGGGDKA